MKPALRLAIDALVIVGGVLVVRDMWRGELGGVGRIWLSFAAFVSVTRMVLDDLIAWRES